MVNHNPKYKIPRKQNAVNTNLAVKNSINISVLMEIISNTSIKAFLRSNFLQITYGWVCNHKLFTTSVTACSVILIIEQLFRPSRSSLLPLASIKKRALALGKSRYSSVLNRSRGRESVVTGYHTIILKIGETMCVFHDIATYY